MPPSRDILLKPMRNDCFFFLYLLLFTLTLRFLSRLLVFLLPSSISSLVFPSVTMIDRPQSFRRSYQFSKHVLEMQPHTHTHTHVSSCQGKCAFKSQTLIKVCVSPSSRSLSRELGLNEGLKRHSGRLDVNFHRWLNQQISSVRHRRAVSFFFKRFGALLGYNGKSSLCGRGCFMEICVHAHSCIYQRRNKQVQGR